MTYFTILRTAAALAVLTAAGAANADVVDFSGSISGLGIAGPDASCAPLPFRGILDASTSSGSSTLGSLTYDHNMCFSGASGPMDGNFDIYLAAGTLFGTFIGTASPTMTMGVADLDLTYTVLGGTGLYDGATGSFGGIATSDIRAGDGSHFNLDFTGSLNVEGVPEPDTWALLLVGFAGVGIALRRDRVRTPKASLA